MGLRRQRSFLVSGCCPRDVDMLSDSHCPRIANDRLPWSTAGDVLPVHVPTTLSIDIDIIVVLRQLNCRREVQSESSTLGLGCHVPATLSVDIADPRHTSLGSHFPLLIRHWLAFRRNDVNEAIACRPVTAIACRKCLVVGRVEAAWVSVLDRQSEQSHL
jgi:hypothetical protein